jgi:Bacterial mobilisation protein (MobC)
MTDPTDCNDPSRQVPSAAKGSARRPRRQVLSQAFIAELAGLRRLTGNLANNINQIARRLNSGGRPDSSIAAAAESVSRVTARLDLALGLAGVPAPPRQEQSAVIPLRDMPFRSHSADPDDHGP